MQQYGDPTEKSKAGEYGYCPDHRTGVKFPDIDITPLQYVD